jgi:hypothetical protein
VSEPSCALRRNTASYNVSGTRLVSKIRVGTNAGHTCSCEIASSRALSTVEYGVAVQTIVQETLVSTSSTQRVAHTLPTTGPTTKLVWNAGPSSTRSDADTLVPPMSSVVESGVDLMPYTVSSGGRMPDADSGVVTYTKQDRKDRGLVGIRPRVSPSNTSVVGVVTSSRYKPSGQPIVCNDSELTTNPNMTRILHAHAMQ